MALPRRFALLLDRLEELDLKEPEPLPPRRYYRHGIRPSNRKLVIAASGGGDSKGQVQDRGGLVAQHRGAETTRKVDGLPSRTNEGEVAKLKGESDDVYDRREQPNATMRRRAAGRAEQRRQAPTRGRRTNGEPLGDTGLSLAEPPPREPKRVAHHYIRPSEQKVGAMRNEGNMPSGIAAMVRQDRENSVMNAQRSQAIRTRTDDYLNQAESDRNQQVLDSIMKFGEGAYRSPYTDPAERRADNLDHQRYLTELAIQARGMSPQQVAARNAEQEMYDRRDQEQRAKRFSAAAELSRRVDDRAGPEGNIKLEPDEISMLRDMVPSLDVNTIFDPGSGRYRTVYGQVEYSGERPPEGEEPQKVVAFYVAPRKGEESSPTPLLNSRGNPVRMNTNVVQRLADMQRLQERQKRGWGVGTNVQPTQREGVINARKRAEFATDRLNTATSAIENAIGSQEQREAEQRYADALRDYKVAMSALDNAEIPPDAVVSAPTLIPQGFNMPRSSAIDLSGSRYGQEMGRGASPSTPRREAPAGALQMLKDNPTPEMLDAFMRKYGYLPPGF